MLVVEDEATELAGDAWSAALVTLPKTEISEIG